MTTIERCVLYGILGLLIGLTVRSMSQPLAQHQTWRCVPNAKVSSAPYVYDCTLLGE